VRHPDRARGRHAAADSARLDRGENGLARRLPSSAIPLVRGSTTQYEIGSTRRAEGHVQGVSTGLENRQSGQTGSWVRIPPPPPPPSKNACTRYRTVLAAVAAGTRRYGAQNRVNAAVPRTPTIAGRSHSGDTDAVASPAPGELRCAGPPSGTVHGDSDPARRGWTALEMSLQPSGSSHHVGSDLPSSRRLSAVDLLAQCAGRGSGHPARARPGEGDARPVRPAGPYRPGSCPRGRLTCSPQNT
jgi:hypothetical protein